MTERILAVLGAAFLVVGPARQATADVKKAQSLAVAWHASELASVLKDWLRFSARVGMGGSTQLLIPPLLIRRVREAIGIWRRYRAALDAFAAVAHESERNAELVEEEIAKAVNWGIVLIGSLFIFAATVVALIVYVT